MNRHFRPEVPPAALALLGAVVLSAAVLAAGIAPARFDASAARMSAEFTGEVSAAGPVYRLPSVEVRGVRSVELAIADLIDRALERRPSAPPPARPDA